STFVHDAGAWMMVALVLGHVAMALTHPEALSSMLSGRISMSWARANAPRWAAEVDEADGPEG
ncbi:MAG: formate dehydrogenase, partial [Acidobacteriota bacterium]|nr:formate dehydrogenase [Acidobacteriota bacterium]